MIIVSQFAHTTLGKSREEQSAQSRVYFTRQLSFLKQRAHLAVRKILTNLTYEKWLNCRQLDFRDARP